MAVANTADEQVVQKGEGPFDLLIRLGALMGMVTALLTAAQGVLDALRSREIAALLPLLIGLLIVLALVAAISALTWLARRSRSAVVGFLATTVLAMVTTVLGLALAASVLPHFGYQLALQRVSEAPVIFAERAESEGALPRISDEGAVDAPAEEAPASAEAPAPPAPVEGERASEAPAAVAEASGHASYDACAAQAQAQAVSPDALEEALIACLAQ